MMDKLTYSEICKATPPQKNQSHCNVWEITTFLYLQYKDLIFIHKYIHLSITKDKSFLKFLYLKCSQYKLNVIKLLF